MLAEGAIQMLQLPHLQEISEWSEVSTKVAAVSSWAPHRSTLQDDNPVTD